MTPEQAREHMEFNKRVERLHGDALLDAQLDFDALPPAEEGEHDLRFLKGLSLQAALLTEFGLDAYKLVAARKEARGDG